MMISFFLTSKDFVFDMLFWGAQNEENFPLKFSLFWFYILHFKSIDWLYLCYFSKSKMLIFPRIPLVFKKKMVIFFFEEKWSEFEKKFDIKIKGLFSKILVQKKNK